MINTITRLVFHGIPQPDIVLTGQRVNMYEQLTNLLLKRPARKEKKTTDGELKELIHDNAKLVRGQKRIACSIALKIAVETHVSPKKVSRICSEEGVKIRSCMLDCFE